MALAALILAILSLAVATAALGWQVIVWRRSSHRVSVTVEPGREVHDHQSGESVVIVTGINLGRASVGILGWGFEFNGKLIWGHEPPANGPKLPRTLDASHQVTFYRHRAVFDAEIIKFGHDGDVRAFVGLATGERIMSHPFSLPD